ncbi:hypothetical protein B0J13DRAFT_558544 [Dactylonectria estremocensis]|uniref:N-acetyltransferase domain-containing protein n=1 Tax=Dactylonectria estremocensis TaxID=1079267 RepID=A0A9P9J3D8_9HYPO|nr:hypothetical protein B0J13DRAFT_558544 [Dactylonectria estremocensis]
MNYKVITLPKSLPDPAQWEQLIARYKAFRLLSLQLSPEAFGSSYAREAAFPREAWVSRLSNPVAFNTIVVPDPQPGSTDNLSLVLNADWLGALTIVGPLESKTAARTYEQKMHLCPDIVDFGPPAPGVESTYVLNAVYVLPAERRKGLASLTVENAKQLAVEIEGSTVTLALILDFDNVPATKSYEKSGFKLVHDYWFDDPRGTTPRKTHAAVMRIDYGPSDS